MNTIVVINLCIKVVCCSYQPIWLVDWFIHCISWITDPVSHKNEDSLLKRITFWLKLFDTVQKTTVDSWCNYILQETSKAYLYFTCVSTWSTSKMKIYTSLPLQNITHSICFPQKRHIISTNSTARLERTTNGIDIPTFCCFLMLKYF